MIKKHISGCAAHILYDTAEAVLDVVEHDWNEWYASIISISYFNAPAPESKNYRSGDDTFFNGK